jgi:hypothetical protein
LVFNEDGIDPVVVLIRDVNSTILCFLERQDFPHRVKKANRVIAYDRHGDCLVAPCLVRSYVQNAQSAQAKISA